MGDYFQIGAPQHRAQKRLAGVPAHASTLIDFKLAHAVVVAAVEVLRTAHASLLGGLREAIENIPAQALLLHPPFTARAVLMVTTAPVVFAAFKHGQYRLPRPTGICGERRPLVVVARLAP